MLAAFGIEHQFLSVEEAVGQPFEARVRSIWPFLVRRVLAFQAKLKPREVANFDVEDTLAELFVALAERDAKWSPERGNYITFAGRIIGNELQAIRDKSRTVHSPRNSSCRLKEYRIEEESGGLSAKRRLTQDDIKRTSHGTKALGPEDRGGVGACPRGEPVAAIIEAEIAAERADGLRTAVGSLTAEEAEALGSSTGIFGHEVRSALEVAERMRKTKVEVVNLRARARIKVREHLLAAGHPAAEAAKAGLRRRARAS